MFQQSLWTAVVTPFKKTGNEIDFESLSTLLRIQEHHQNGLIIMGSTGENLSLTDAEKLQIVEFTCSLNLAVPVLCGISSYNLDKALEWIEICNQFPINGYLMPTPMYTKPGIHGQTYWFEKLLNKAARPCMLYNIPGRACTSLHPAVVSNLAQHESFCAIKDSSGIAESLTEYKKAAPSLHVYCGDDNMMQQTARAGAVGLVSVASNAWPEITKWYVECCLKGVGINHTPWISATNALFTASNPIPIKSLLESIGLIASADVRPPLSTEDLYSGDQLLTANNIITDWYERNASR